MHSVRCQMTHYYKATIREKWGTIKIISAPIYKLLLPDYPLERNQAVVRAGSASLAHQQNGWVKKRWKTERGKERQGPNIPVLVAWLTRLTHQSASPSVFHPSVVNLLLTPPSIATHSHSHSLVSSPSGSLTYSHTHTQTEIYKGCFSQKKRHRGEAGVCEGEKWCVCVVRRQFSASC